jgi:peptide subunit release factor 1 (eRF1)
VRANGEASVAADLRRIESHVKAGIDRSHTRGLAIFACSAHDLWEVITLPVPVHSRVIINALPALGQLEAVVREDERIGVLLADRQRARMFVFQLGELQEHSERFDALPRQYDERGEKERGDVQHHVEALATQHLRNAAALAWTVYQETGFDHLVVGAADEIATALESALHPYLISRLAGRVAVPVAAALEDVRAATLAAQTAIERRKETEVVSRLRQAVATSRRGVSGLTNVLGALNERRIGRLLVSQGYESPGWRCASCAHLAVIGPRCPACDHTMDRVDDVVEEAVEEALAQSCRVEICMNSADLDVLGRIGALLRY